MLLEIKKEEIFIGYMNDADYLSKIDENKQFVSEQSVPEDNKYIMYPPYYNIADIIKLYERHPGKYMINFFDIDGEVESVKTYLGSGILYRNTSNDNYIVLDIKDKKKSLDIASVLLRRNIYGKYYSLLDDVNIEGINFIGLAHTIQVDFNKTILFFYKVGDRLLLGDYYESKKREITGYKYGDVQLSDPEKYFVDLIKEDIHSKRFTELALNMGALKCLNFTESVLIPFKTYNKSDNEKFRFLKNTANLCHLHTFLWCMFSCEHVRDYINNVDLRICSNIELLFICCLCIYAGSTNHIKYNEDTIIGILKKRGIDVEKYNDTFENNTKTANILLGTFIKQATEKKDKVGATDDSYLQYIRYTDYIKNVSSMPLLFSTCILEYTGDCYLVNFTEKIKDKKNYIITTDIPSRTFIKEKIYKDKDGSIKDTVDKRVNIWNLSTYVKKTSKILVFKSNKLPNTETHIKLFKDAIVNFQKELKNAIKNKIFSDIQNIKNHIVKKEEDIKLLEEPIWRSDIPLSLKLEEKEYELRSYSIHTTGHYYSYSKIGENYYIMNDIDNDIKETVEKEFKGNLSSKKSNNVVSLFYELQQL